MTEPAKPKGPPLADRIRTALLRAVLWGLRYTPWRARWGLARLTGLLAARRHRRRRHAAQINLELAFGDALSAREKEIIATRSFQNFIGCMADMVSIIPRMTPDNWHRFVHVSEQDLEEVRAAVAEGKGVLVMFSHYGNWELMGTAMSFMGLPRVNAVAKRQSAWSNPVLEDLRTMHGNTVIYKEGAARKTLYALKKGEIVGFAIDQNYSQGVFVPFFGLEAGTPDTLAGLARASGAPILPFTCLPTGDGSYTGRFLPLIHARVTGNKEADILHTTRECLAALEGVIRERPEYWLWSHKRWKARPPHEQPARRLYQTAAMRH